MAGSTEYMAMEKLYELYQEEPLRPAGPRHAADPQRARLPRRARADVALHRLALAAVLPEAGRLGLKVLGRGGGIAVQRAQADHRRRPAARPLRLLRRASATWPTGSASGPSGWASCSALRRDDVPGRHLAAARLDRRGVFFRRRLREGGMPFGGAIVNRVHDQERARGDADVDGRPRRRCSATKLARKVARNFEDYRELAARDRERSTGSSARRAASRDARAASGGRRARHGRPAAR